MDPLDPQVPRVPLDPGVKMVHKVLEGRGVNLGREVEMVSLAPQAVKDREESLGCQGKLANQDHQDLQDPLDLGVNLAREESRDREESLAPLAPQEHLEEMVHVICSIIPFALFHLDA